MHETSAPKPTRKRYVRWNSPRNGNDGRPPTGIGFNSTKWHIVDEERTDPGSHGWQNDNRPFGTWCNVPRNDVRHEITTGTPAPDQICKLCLKVQRKIEHDQTITKIEAAGAVVSDIVSKWNRLYRGNDQ